MTEWLILLLAVAAIVVPVVLLFGFAGCEFKRGHIPSVLLIDSVTGTGVDTIAVEWTYDSVPTKFQLERDGTIADDVDGAERRWEDDSGLAEGSEHSYRVGAVIGDDLPDWSPEVRGKTLTFLPTFSAPLDEDEPGWADYCLVQRIEPEPTRLLRSGPQVRITIRSSSTAELTIDSIFISRVAAGGDPYDSAADLTQVASAVTVPAGTAKVLPHVSYALDHTQPLLVAVDFNSTPGSGNVRRDSGVPGSEASAFYKEGVREAGVNDRQNYTPTDPNAVVLIEKIEVAAAA